MVELDLATCICGIIVVFYVNKSAPWQHTDIKILIWSFYFTITQDPNFLTPFVLSMYMYASMLIGYQSRKNTVPHTHKNVARIAWVMRCIIYLQMYLHSPDDLPRIRDLGFAIAPGTHTLVGTMLTKVRQLFGLRYTPQTSHKMFWSAFPFWMYTCAFHLILTLYFAFVGFCCRGWYFHMWIIVSLHA